jgi:hypothetical protein
MKTDKRLDAEIKAVAEIWNSTHDDNPSSDLNKRIAAVYHSLCWARGKREMAPSQAVQRMVEKKHYLDAN